MSTDREDEGISEGQNQRNWRREINTYGMIAEEKPDKGRQHLTGNFDIIYSESFHCGVEPNYQDVQMKDQVLKNVEKNIWLIGKGKWNISI